MTDQSVPESQRYCGLHCRLLQILSGLFDGDFILGCSPRYLLVPWSAKF